MKITIEILPDEIREWSYIDEIEYENLPLIISRIMSGFTRRERTVISTETVLGEDGNRDT